MSKRAFVKGDLISYLKDSGSKNPSFMLWHEIQPSGMPSLDWHPHKWSCNDVAIILERNDEFLKILKAGGGIGWVLAAWCKK